MCPLEKTGETENISKETITKIKYKQMMWKKYIHTGNEEDYTIYTEALNQATAEIQREAMKTN